MKKRMSMKPVLLVELLMIAVLFGVGSAFAITVNPLPNQLDPWAGEENITESANLAVSNYDFNYNADLTGVSGVTVTVSNSDTAAHDATVYVAVGNATATETDTVGPLAVPLSGTADFVATFAADVDLANLDLIRIIIDETV